MLLEGSWKLWSLFFKHLLHIPFFKNARVRMRIAQVARLLRIRLKRTLGMVITDNYCFKERQIAIAVSQIAKPYIKFILKSFA